MTTHSFLDQNNAYFNCTNGFYMILCAVAVEAHTHKFTCISVFNTALLYECVLRFNILERQLDDG